MKRNLVSSLSTHAVFTPTDASSSKQNFGDWSGISLSSYRQVKKSRPIAQISKIMIKIWIDRRRFLSEVFLLCYFDNFDWCCLRSSSKWMFTERSMYTSDRNIIKSLLFHIQQKLVPINHEFVSKCRRKRCESIEILSDCFHRTRHRRGRSFRHSLQISDEGQEATDLYRVFGWKRSDILALNLGE
jgi:hypothetical protein